MAVRAAASKPLAAVGGTPPRRAEGLLFLAALSWVAAMIHAVAAVAHAAEHVSFAVLFAALAVAQTAWGVLVYARPSRAALSAGALVTAGVVAVWLLSRTAGLPVGPEHAPEPVGLADLGATVTELALIAGALACLRRPDAAARLPVWARQAALVVLIFGGVALVTASHVHGHA